MLAIKVATNFFYGNYVFFDSPMQSNLRLKKNFEELMREQYFKIKAILKNYGI